MARPRLPTEVLEVRGSFKAQPSRRRPIGAKSERPLGNEPPGLTKAEVECWREIVGNSVAAVLTSADRVMVEIAARLLAKMRDGSIKSTELSAFTRCLTELGWTPASRHKVAAPAPPPADDFAEFRMQ